MKPSPSALAAAAPTHGAGERPSVSGSPLLWATVGLLGGQAVAPLAAAGVVVALLVAGLLCLLLRPRWPAGALVGVALIAAALGMFQVARLLGPRFDDAHVQRFAGSAVRLRARVAERPQRGVHRTRLLLEVSALRTKEGWRQGSGRVLVTLAEVTRAWRRGDGVEAWLRLRQPRNFGNPGEFDYESFLARRGVYVTSFAADDRAWVRQPAPAGGLAGALERWRDHARRVIRESLAEPEASIVGALLLGESATLAPEVRERYARSGTSHVLAISGLHVGLVAGAAYTVVRWLLARSEWLLLRTTVPKLAVLSTVAPVLLYGALAGGSMATLRAVAMALLVVAAMLLDRRRDWLTALAAAAFGIALWWPGAVFEISFQLSFVAVLSIVLGGRRVRAWWEAREEAQLGRLTGGRARLAARWLVFYEAVTVAASLGTAPLGAWHFNRVSFIGLVANAVIVPVLGFVPVSLGLFAVLLLPFAAGAGEMLLRVVGVVVHAADLLVQGFAALPGAAVRVVTPSLFEIALVYGVLALLLTPASRARRALLIVCVVLAGLDGGSWYVSRFHRASLTITFLSVGQGDSTLIEFPGSAVMVVDGGGLSATFDVGERIVAPQLWRRKIGRVDLLALTHADFDHYGGLGFLARTFGPAEFWWNGSPGGGERFAALWESLGPASVRAVRPGFRRSIGGVEVRVLHPPASTRFDGDNDRSLTVRLGYGPTTVLLPGDLEEAGELALVEAEKGNLASTVLKVPHHGSRTSSSARFLDAVRPALAVVSNGHGNPFGFPHQRVVEAYRARGVEVLRTDLDGAVSVRIDADGRITIETGRATKSCSVDPASKPSAVVRVFCS